MGRLSPRDRIERLEQIIGLGEEVKLVHLTFGVRPPGEPFRDDAERLGLVFIAGSPSAQQKALDEILQREKADPTRCPLCSCSSHQCVQVRGSVNAGGDEGTPSMQDSAPSGEATVDAGVLAQSEPTIERRNGAD